MSEKADSQSRVYLLQRRPDSSLPQGMYTPSPPYCTPHRPAIVSPSTAPILSNCWYTSFSPHTDSTYPPLTLQYPSPPPTLPPTPAPLSPNSHRVLEARDGSGQLQGRDLSAGTNSTAYCHHSSPVQPTAVNGFDFCQPGAENLESEEAGSSGSARHGSARHGRQSSYPRLQLQPGPDCVPTSSQTYRSCSIRPFFVALGCLATVTKRGSGYPPFP